MGVSVTFCLLLGLFSSCWVALSSLYMLAFVLLHLALYYLAFMFRPALFWRGNRGEEEWFLERVDVGGSEEKCMEEM